jgi:hypothetical protein
MKTVYSHGWCKSASNVPVVDNPFWARRDLDGVVNV